MVKNLFNKPVFDQFPELETARLRLVEIKPDHAPDIYAHFSNEAVTRYLDLNCMVEPEEAERLIDFLAKRFTQERGLRWGVQPKGEEQIIGTCGFNIWSKGKFQAELGYDLSPAHWRQGLMTEAVAAVLDFGFSRMELHKIEALVWPANTPSETFLKQLGFQWQGMVREFRASTGRQAAMHLFEMVKVQWLWRQPARVDFRF